MKAKGKPFPVVITIRLELLSVALFYKIPAFFGLIIPPVKSRIWYCKETITLWGIIFAALSMPLKTSGFGAAPQLYVKSVALKSVF
jgi:hypothetical protein